MTEFDHDLAVVGAGRIGLPWAAVLAADQGLSVTCIDIDHDRVRNINDGQAPFSEPGLAERMRSATDSSQLRATTDPQVISDHEYVAFTVNAPRNAIIDYLRTIESYTGYLVDGQVVISRSTLPVDTVDQTKQAIERESDADIIFAVFPERLAEGKAVEEIKSLPKIVGVNTDHGEQKLREFLEPFDCPIRVTDPETAMLVKLIDNSYRDALFAIANQIAYTADELELDAHQAIDLANFDYPRNDIPTPGTVGGKCLPKDPHFLTDEHVCEQPKTPDLFNATRRTNASLQSYIVTQVLRLQPTDIGVLGLSYKSGVGDSFNSPAFDIAEELDSLGLNVRAHDPYIPDFDGSLRDTLHGADVAILAVNHPEFEEIEPILNEMLVEKGTVYDLWGVLDPHELDVEYTGFGIN